MVCHPERSEGSSLNASQILRFAQNDNAGGDLSIIRAVRKLYQYQPSRPSGHFFLRPSRKAMASSSTRTASLMGRAGGEQERTEGTEDARKHPPCPSEEGNMLLYR